MSYHRGLRVILRIAQRKNHFDPQSPRLSVPESPSLPVSLSLSRSESPGHLCRCRKQRAENTGGLFFYQDFTPPGYLPVLPFHNQGTMGRIHIGLLCNDRFTAPGFHSFFPFSFSFLRPPVSISFLRSPVL
jgi:hypothetical protein